MAKKDLLRAAAFLLLSAGLAVGVYAQVTISGGLALSYMTAESDYVSLDGDIGIGGNVYLDYLLPVGVPLSLGAEVGVDSSSFSYPGGKDTVLAIPLLLRVAYHFDLMAKLDLYAVGKIGYSFGVWTGTTKDQIDSIPDSGIEGPSGLAFGVDIGAAYYFTPVIGAFAEAGFDRYNLEAKFKIGSDSEYIRAPFNRFFTAGLSVKF